MAKCLGDIPSRNRHTDLSILVIILSILINGCIIYNLFETSNKIAAFIIIANDKFIICDKFIKDDLKREQQLQGL